MSELFSFYDLQHFILIKFILFLFLGVGLFWIWKKWSLCHFLIFTGLCAGAAYFILVHGMNRMFWGLKGDEVTIAAMYNTFAHKSFFSDFAYTSLPPFYPPLFFWIFAFFGRLFNWNGIQIAKLASFITIVCFPVFIYLVQFFYAKYNKARELNIPDRIAFFLAPLLVYVFIDWDAIILKPYEMLTVALSVLWVSFLLVDLNLGKLSWKRISVYGISGGIIFMTYYLWLVFGAIAIALAGLWVKKEHQGKYYFDLLKIGAITLLVASPYLLPLIWTYQKLGTENWQTILLTFKGISYYSVFEFFSWRGLLMLLGLVSIIWYRNYVYVRALVLLFVTAYIWQLMGLVTVFFFASPIQEFKGFYFFDRIILAFGLAFGISKLWHYLSERFVNRSFQTVAVVIGLIFLSTQMIFGFFIDDPVVQKTRIDSRSIKNSTREVAEFLNKNKTSGLVLQSGILELYALVPMNNFIYFNQHNSNPAGNFTARLSYLKWLTLSKNADEFNQLLNTPYGHIGRLVFMKTDSEFYNLFFDLDNFPHLIKSEKLNLKKQFVNEEYFEKKFENENYIVFDRK